VRDLIDHGVKGCNFYTLNRSKATLTIYETLASRMVSPAGELESLGITRHSSC